MRSTSRTRFALLQILTAVGVSGCGGDDGEDTREVPTMYPQDGYCNDAGVPWAWCEDFDGQGADGPAAFDPASAGIDFHSHSHGSLAGVYCGSTVEEGKTCDPFMQGGSLMLNAEDGGFGMQVLRVEQPFDFTEREGRIHYRSNMKGHGRMFQTVHISPQLSNSLPDLRDLDPAINDAPAISMSFVGDGGWPFGIVIWNDGQVVEEHHVDGPLGIEVGTGAALADVDFYLSRGHLRVAIDGVVRFDKDIVDLGFERGYVYFAQLAYNPNKDGYVGENANRFLWDDLAFDGPSLAKNSLTPLGKQEVLFRGWNIDSCTVRGVRADGWVTPIWGLFETWHAQLDDDGAPVTMDDIECTTLDTTPPLGGQPAPPQVDVRALGELHVFKP